MDLKELEKNYDKEISLLESTKESLRLKEGMMRMSKREIMNEIKDKRNGAKWVLTTAASFLLVFSMLTTSVLAFPQVARKYAKSMPIVKEVVKMEDEVTKNRESYKELEREVEEVKIEKDETIKTLEEKIESLEIKLKEVAGEEIKEVVTSELEDEEINQALQDNVVLFVKAMYDNDIDTALGFVHEDFKEHVINHPEDIIRGGSDALIFTQITNVAKVEENLYLVFLRLNDMTNEADYQLDFEIVNQDGKYYITFVGLDA